MDNHAGKTAALPAGFFSRDSLQVARDLLGCLVVHEHVDGVMAARIVETEAYAQDDPACHAWGLLDEETGELSPGRGADLFGPPGSAYVYLIYGMYWLLNVVTEPEGVCGAVLIRAAEPVEGEELMAARRAAARKRVDLTNGPGKLTQALDIGAEYHGQMLTQGPLYFAAGQNERDRAIARSSRIGISKGVDLQWRFFLENHPFVSTGTSSDER